MAERTLLQEQCSYEGSLVSQTSFAGWSHADVLNIDSLAHVTDLQNPLLLPDLGIKRNLISSMLATNYTFRWG